MIDNPLYRLAYRIAEWLDREGFKEHQKDLRPWWPENTVFWDDGRLPSGDTFTVWLACDLTYPEVVR